MTSTDPLLTRRPDAPVTELRPHVRHRGVAVVVGVLGVIATTAVLLVGSAVAVTDGSFTEIPRLSSLLEQSASPRVAEIASDAAAVEALALEAVQRTAWWFDAVAAQRAERVLAD